MVDLVQWLPALAGLGVGGVIVGWAGAGRARREVRSAVLDAIEGTETARWAGLADEDDGGNWRVFRAAVNKVETTALVARIPRKAVHHYIVLAETARRLSDEDYENRDGDEELAAGSIGAPFADLTRHAAEVVTQLAWRPWVSRVRYRWQLRKMRQQALEIAVSDRDVERLIQHSQAQQGQLSKRFGELSRRSG